MYLTPEAIQKTLETKLLGKSIEVHKTVVSTNDLAWAAAKAGKEEGLVILAEYQSKGRGRMSRDWHAPRASSILMSILLRPPAVSSAPALTVGAALAACRACAGNAPVKCKVKWPNDVFVNGKKVAGVLAESRQLAKGGAGLPVYVVGIGINVNLSRPAFPKEIRESATSLRAETKKMYDRNPIVASFLNEFDANYEFIRERHWGGHEVEFFERLGLADQEVEVKTANKSYRGLLRAVSLDTGITLEDAKGLRQSILCEHVLSLGLPQPSKNSRK